MPKGLILALLFAPICGAACALSLPSLMRALKRRGVMDVPGPRSNHAAPVPRGGGLAIIAPITAGWLLLNAAAGADGFIWSTLAGFVLLAVISWRDDRTPQPIGLRLAVQALAVAVPLALLSDDMRMMPPSVPLVAERAFLAIAWMWLVNAMNFMDGLDGLAAGQAMTASSGTFILGAFFLPMAYAGVALPVSAALAAAALAFLPFNWPPARIFLGDTGSVPMGYLIGWMSLLLAVSGAPAAAVILPACFLTDATATLLGRMMRGENIAEPHSGHIYQRARRAGKSHAWVTTRALAANAALVVCALLSAASPLYGLAAAAAVVTALMVTFCTAARSNLT